MRAFNDRGQILVGAVVSEDVRPGVVRISEGAWFDPADPAQPGSLCKNGNVNCLTFDIGSSSLAQGNCGQMAQLQIEVSGAGIEKYRARGAARRLIYRQAGAQRAALVAARHIRLPFAEGRFAFHFNGRMMRATFLFDEFSTTMPTSSAVTRRAPDLTSLAFLAVAFLTGIAGALQTPTLSLFLETEVKVRPALVGLFFTGSAVIGILVSQFLAGRSDKRGDRKSLIFLCCMLGALGFTLFAWNRDYYLLLIVGVVLTSFGSTANPQMFALAREHADRTGREAVMFTSIMRAQVSLAWVIGPPIAFALALGFGFKAMYLRARRPLYCAACWCGNSCPRCRNRGDERALAAPRQHRRDSLLLFVACTLMWTANSMYLINMPLYVVHELRLPERLAGILMGAAAGLEIPIMLLAGLAAKHCGKRRLMRQGGGRRRAVLLLPAVYHRQLAAHRPATAECGVYRRAGGDRHALLSGFDARPGRAPTLFTNTTRVGWIIAGSIAGAVANLELPCGVLRRAGDDGGGHAVPVAVERQLRARCPLPAWRDKSAPDRGDRGTCRGAAAGCRTLSAAAANETGRSAAVHPGECSGYSRACRSACRGSGWILTARYSRRRSRCDSPSALLLVGWGEARQ